MNKTIGILGGMGPLATADLYTKLVLETRADGDSGHIRVFMDSNPHIPDRTAAILHGGESPLSEMEKCVRSLEKCGADCIIMPCNTAHFFLRDLQAMTDIPFISMLDTAAQCGAKRFPGKKAALLATAGTYSANIYSEPLARAGVEFLTPDERQIETLMRCIYTVKAGGDIQALRTDFMDLLAELRANGAEYFFLGCTELPLVAQQLNADGPFIDPTIELARAAIRFCGYETVSGE